MRTVSPMISTIGIFVPDRVEFWDFFRTSVDLHNHIIFVVRNSVERTTIRNEALFSSSRSTCSLSLSNKIVRLYDLCLSDDCHSRRQSDRNGIRQITQLSDSTSLLLERTHRLIKLSPLIARAKTLPTEIAN